MAFSTPVQPPGTLFHPTFTTLLTPVHSENDSSVLFDRAYNWLLLALLVVSYSGALHISHWLIDWLIKHRSLQWLLEVIQLKASETWMSEVVRQRARRSRSSTWASFSSRLYFSANFINFRHRVDSSSLARSTSDLSESRSSIEAIFFRSNSRCTS